MSLPGGRSPLLAVSPACSRKAPEEPPVATPSVTLNHDKVPIGSPVKLTYKFTVAPNAPDIIKGEDYWVFVHVLDPTGEQLWTDDHRAGPGRRRLEARADDRIHPDGVRPQLPVHRRGGRCGSACTTGVRASG